MALAELGKPDRRHNDPPPQQATHRKPPEPCPPCGHLSRDLAYPPWREVGRRSLTIGGCRHGFHACAQSSLWPDAIRPLEALCAGAAVAISVPTPFFPESLVPFFPEGVGDGLLRVRIQITVMAAVKERGLSPAHLFCARCHHLIRAGVAIGNGSGIIIFVAACWKTFTKPLVLHVSFYELFSYSLNCV